MIETGFLFTIGVVLAIVALVAGVAALGAVLYAIGELLETWNDLSRSVKGWGMAFFCAVAFSPHVAALGFLLLGNPKEHVLWLLALAPTLVILAFIGHWIWRLARWIGLWAEVTYRIALWVERWRHERGKTL